MTAAPARTAPSGPSSSREARRVTWASLVGTSLEQFDFYLFGYFSAFFVGPLFFEPLGAAGATLASFSTIAVSFVIRPVGAIVFGHMGDRLGRRATLLWTVAVMGVATGLIGLLPSYEQAGWLGAVGLVVLRLAQGMSLGGEWGGSVLLAAEHAHPLRRALYAAIPQLGSPVGSILSAAVYLLLIGVMPSDQIAAWGWRLPFLLAFPMLLVSLYLRLRVDETPVFSKLKGAGGRDRLPVLDMLRARPAGVLIAICSALLGIGSYSLMNTYTMNYGSEVLGYSPLQLLIATTIGSLLQLATIPLFGLLATRIGSARVVGIGALGSALIAVPMYALLPSAGFGVLVGMMIIGGILPTMSWAALGGLMSDLFDERFRYSALSLAYAIAATASGFVPLLTAALGRATDEAWWHPALMLIAMSALTLLGAVLAGRRAPSGALGSSGVADGALDRGAARRR
ncbi:MFS transporter [Brachybacterium endophyticum]|uniref:MFS transporter n=1 Tax=Brachybacterium endophyticum TaxID=2182385 RepID=A0A2U2RK10_9MICO|nr:MFS transporter [Brachybacterium endophyticum]PWH06207.1 MFS transporter [Brachybacterium endophyticum]